MLTIPEEIRQAVDEASGKPVRLTDPQTKEEYIVIRKSLFDLLSDSITESVLTPAEQTQLLVEAGLRAGWDDPAMDVYNDLAPKRS